jgi:hypothetical protein
MEVIFMKLCKTCGKERDESEFNKRTASPDGLSHKCKFCQREYDKKRAECPKRKAARKEYAKTPAGIEAGNRAKKKWLENNEVKRAAHIILGNAVRDGKIVKPNKCSECGFEGKIHGHHDDYAFPLKVKWLCSICHKKEHI